MTEEQKVALDKADDIALAERMQEACGRILGELHKLIVGQDEVIEQVMLSLFVGGNSLIVGVPGLAKTLLIHSIAQVLDLKFSRIQFTPDLMPSDITGTDLIQEDAETGQRKMVFAPGPVFANIVLAFATQNPIELEGTYPLPEAQLDRFMFKINMDHLPVDEELEVVRSTTAVQEYHFENVVTGEDIVAYQHLVRKVPVSEAVLRFTLEIVRTTRPNGDGSPEFISRWVSYGASVRAAQYLVLGAKARALIRGRYHVNFDDIRALAGPVLRHRILTNFHAESEQVTSDQLIDQLLEAIPTPSSGL
jgi:MoxR-like ATPase